MGRTQHGTGTSRKGVSPLIAAVLLIAFTMAVAAILTAWVTTFTNEQTQQISNSTDDLVECSYASVDVFDASYDSGNRAVDVTVANTGTVDLNNVSIYTFRDAAVQNRTYIDGLNAGALKSTSIQPVGNQPDRIRVASVDCPQREAQSTNIN